MSSHRKWAELNEKEQEKLQLILFSLQEFSYGFERTDEIAPIVGDGAAPLRFYMNSLYQYCASYFLIAGHDKLGDVVTSLGSGDLLTEIEEILNKKLGDTSFGEIIRIYRNKILTHPSYMFGALDEKVHGKYDILNSENALEFSGLVNDLHFRIQKLYANLIARFPEAV